VDAPEPLLEVADAAADTVAWPPGPAVDADADLTVRFTPSGAALSPNFPGRDPGTGLVLYGHDGTLHAHWRLEANDLERAGGSFPSAGGRPLPVVRLCRVRPDGGSDQVNQVDLQARVREGVGEAGFAVAADHGRYHAELGLTNGDGGWLMLARSNALDNVSPVGVDLAGLEAAPCAALAASGPAVPVPTVPTSVSLAGPSSLVPSPGLLGTDDQEPALALAPGTPEAPAGPFPLVAPALPPPWAAAAVPALPGQAPWYGPAGAVAVAVAAAPGLNLMLGLPRLDRDVPLPADAAPGAPDRDGRGTPSPPPVLVLSVLELRGLRLPAPGEPVPVPDDPAAARPAPNPIPTDTDQIPTDPLTGAPAAPGLDWTLHYGQAPRRHGVLEVEAELHIRGQAAPGSLVDLFGHPFRIGPGGRFQLVVRVDDPSLVRSALFLNPPPELSRSRDD